MCEFSAFPGTDAAMVSGEKPCVDGSVWKEQCNTCNCFKGYPMCTKIGCYGLKPEDWLPIEKV